MKFVYGVNVVKFDKVWLASKEKAMRQNAEHLHVSLFFILLLVIFLCYKKKRLPIIIVYDVTRHYTFTIHCTLIQTGWYICSELWYAIDFVLWSFRSVVHNKGSVNQLIDNGYNLMCTLSENNQKYLYTTAQIPNWWMSELLCSHHWSIFFNHYGPYSWKRNNLCRPLFQE